MSSLPRISYVNPYGWPISSFARKEPTLPIEIVLLDSVQRWQESRQKTTHASFSTLKPLVSPLGSLSRTVCPDWMVVALNEFRALVASSRSAISIRLRRPNGPPTNLDGGVAKEMIRCGTVFGN